MKITKKPVSKRTKPVKKTRKTVAKLARPLHKRVLLHPFSVMVMLCVGVILAGSTYRSLAASYNVTATVKAPPVTAAAFIATPSDSQHVNFHQVTVTGSCPAETYVKLYRGATFSGAATCTAQAFQVQTTLDPGANQLQAKVYNVTDEEGPASPPVTVYYDDTTATPPPAPPVAVPTTMWVTSVDSSTYQQGGVQAVSSRPTVSGYAVPYADIVVTFHSEVAICKTRADAMGWWTCTLDHSLPDGVHHVDVAATNGQGWSALLPTFEIRVRSTLPNLLKPQAMASAPLILADYKFQTHYVGQPFKWSLSLQGGSGPYTLTVDWGDDSHSIFNRVTGDEFSFAHAYPAVKTYTVFVKVVDVKGTTALLQLSATVKGQQAVGVASLVSSGPLASLSSSIQRYLWVVWPVYLSVVLMVCSYWLGEQDVYQRFRRHRVAVAGRKR